jgi:hypothetical protein
MYNSQKEIMGNQSKLIVLREYWNDVEAHIAKGVLETNGIPCIINNEIMSSIYPLSHTSFGAIKLLVRSEDAELAEQLLDNEPNLCIED